MSGQENTPTKRTIIEFVGGDMDGRKVDSQTASKAELELIDTVLDMTKGGKVGGAFHGISFSQLERLRKGSISSMPKLKPGHSHKYTIEDRDETEDELKLLIRHSIRVRENKADA